MKVYTNNKHQIIDIGSTKNPVLTELEVPDQTFGDIEDSQIKCYSCILDAEGNPSIELLVSRDLFEQIGRLDRQHMDDQKEIMILTESIIENDYRLSIFDLGI